MADTDPARLIDVIAGFQAADARMDVHAGRLSALEADEGGGDGITQEQADARYQPLDSDLSAIAALATTAFGRALLTLADAATGRTAFGLGTAATAAVGDFQPANAGLTAIAALTTTSYGRGLLVLADAAAGRTALGLGSAATSASGDFQAADSDLAAIAALTTTAYGRGLLTLANVAALKTSLSLVKADVGLGNVDNTSDASKPVSATQQAALDLKANLSDTIISVTTGRALATTDNGAVLEVNSASAVTLTVPSTMPVGFNCIVSQVGAGQVTVAAGTSATVTAYQGAKTPGQWGEVAVRVRGTAGVAVVSGGVA